MNTYLCREHAVGIKHACSLRKIMLKISERCFVRVLNLLSIWKQSCTLVPKKSEDIKGAIRIRISKKNRQHNVQKKRHKMTNNDLQNIHIKLKIE